MDEFTGIYYLHTDGNVIFKRDFPGLEADMLESDFVVTWWHFNTRYRQDAWKILVEASAGGADPKRIQDLAGKWRCDNDDAFHYASFVGFRLYMDGDQWCATRDDFQNLQESPAGLGATALEAIAELAKALGYKPKKAFGSAFSDLVKVKETKTQ